MEKSNPSSSVKTGVYNRRTRPARRSMENSNSLSSAKTRGYDRRTRSASKTRTYRRRRQPPSENYDVHNNVSNNNNISNSDNNNNNISNSDNNNEIISIPIPSMVSTDWLLRTAPIALARHLLYVRGLWPMSVQQLLLLLQQQEDNNNNNIHSGDNSDSNHDIMVGRINNSRNNGDTDNDTTANKRRRMNNTNTKKKGTKINPSLRRKQTKAMDQITRLCDEWRLALTVNQHHHQKLKQKLPLFLLISLGPSYGQSRELYLLDFQSLIDDDDDDDDPVAVGNNETDKENNSNNYSYAKEQKLEATLMRKLVGALMNAEGENSLSNSLPCKSSPRFRLWFTAGFKITTAANSANENKDIYDTTAAAAAVDHDAFISSSSTISWIPRTRFPRLSKQIVQSKASSRKQSLVTIRFHRRQQQQEQQLQNSLLQPTSEQLTWMSLTTGVKGFRL
jgi:hypothetical protein